VTAPALDLAIVTSVRDYGQYLGDWATSILALRRKPAMVAMVEQGSLDDSWSRVQDAAARLRAGGLEVAVRQMPATDMGTARNAAVALARSEWVLHLDADDRIMPHALDDAARLAPNADVIAFGYERCGDLLSGPRQRIKLYKSSIGPGALENPTPASGVSPFRRSFWERAPYRVDQRGGWDTSLWLGFAHLGARFVATSRPCFWYRQHADSLFNVRRMGGWTATLVGTQLQSRRRGDSGVSVLVPRGAEDSPERVRAWRWLARRLAALYPHWQVIEGRSSNPWCKGLAVRDALSRATGATLVVLDADCVLPAAALREAVALVASGAAPWVVPHTMVHRLSQQATVDWLGQDPAVAVAAPDRDALARPTYQGYPGGGVFIVSRPAFAAFGGIPTAMVGWGAEDEAAAVIMDTLLGPHQRLAYDLVHLWHAPQTTKQHGDYRRNRPIFRRYLAAKGDEEAMWLTVQHLGGLVDDGRFAAARRYRTLARAGARPSEADTSAMTAIHDTFAQRRLALARGRQLGRDPMAAARDITVEHARARREQHNLNRQAVIEAEQVRATLLAMVPGTPEARRRAENAARKMQRFPDGEDKMLRPELEDKEGVTTSGVTLVGVPFASRIARDLAERGGVPVEVFARRRPGPRGFTAEDVRGVIAEALPAGPAQ
jgi:hypothetical protein